MSLINYEDDLRTLSRHAWDSELQWEEIDAWLNNFTGYALADKDEERRYALFVLTRFMYFGKRLVREMLKSLYRDHFKSPLRQRIRRKLNNTKDVSQIDRIYQQELDSTRFIGVGNPAESGAHLLYFFRQINYLPKNIFADISGAFHPVIDQRQNSVTYRPRELNVARYVFFDDMVGSGTQASTYLSVKLKQIRVANPNVDLRFMSLFATTKGLERLNSPELFNGQAISLFELDETYKAFTAESRYFTHSPSWFNRLRLRDLVYLYGMKLRNEMPLGYKDSQLLIGFSHNTPNNTPPLFWYEGKGTPWSPVFIRYDKVY